jgi:hypothetical protein
MPIAKNYRPHKGDVVTICGTIKYNWHDNSIYLFLENESRDLAADLQDVKDVVSFDLQPEDRVIYTKHGEEIGTVVHINGQFAWVKLDDGVDCLIDLIHLQRLDWEPHEESTCEEVNRATVADLQRRGESFADNIKRTVVSMAAVSAMAHGATVPPEMLRGELPERLPADVLEAPQVPEKIDF